MLVGVLVGVSVGVLVGVDVGVSVGVSVGVAVGVVVGVLVGVSVGVLVGVLAGVSVGVFVGVDVGVSVGVSVGVAVGVAVGVGPLKELTTSPAELPLRFQNAAIWEYPPESSALETETGLPVELTVVGLDHDVYGLLASEYPMTPLSMNQAARFDVPV